MQEEEEFSFDIKMKANVKIPRKHLDEIEDYIYENLECIIYQLLMTKMDEVEINNIEPTHY